MTERVLIMRHASGLVNRARRLAIVKWPTAKLEVHDLAAYGKPPADFRWDRYAHLLIDDEYLRKEGLLWLSELRSKPNFPKIVRVLPEPAPAQAARRDRRQGAADAGARNACAEQGFDAPGTGERQPEHDRRASRRGAWPTPKPCSSSAGIEGFTPVKPLGSGATANVCLCERVSDKQQVVLKILKGEGSGDSDLLSRFVQEYFAASSIDSPYVAKVFEHGFTESHAYIVMEYFPAGDLRARMARDRPSVEESLIIVGSILSALTSVHAAGIIHRDLKPANVMFRDDGTIALVDFGSARRDADPVAKTLAGVVIGTPYYLSPEQALGGTADERSDLYSVGVMLYELLTGQRMYAAASLVGAVRDAQERADSEAAGDLARHQRFLERLVSKKPEERYLSAAEAFHGAHGVLDGRSREHRRRWRKWGHSPIC